MTDADRELAIKLLYAKEATEGLPAPIREAVLRKVELGHAEHGQAIRDIPLTEPGLECLDLIGYEMLWREAGIKVDDPDLCLYRELTRRLLACTNDLTIRAGALRKRRTARTSADAEKRAEKPATRKRGGIHTLGEMTGQDARFLRAQARLTQKQVAEIIGSAQVTVKHCEAKGREPITAEMERRYERLVRHLERDAE